MIPVFIILDAIYRSALNKDVLKTEGENNMKNEQQIINDTEQPVLATLLTKFLEYSEDAIREVATSKGRNLKSLTAAANRGMKKKDISLAFKKAKDKAVYAAVGADTKWSKDKLAETALQNHLKVYVQAA